MQSDCLYEAVLAIYIWKPDGRWQPSANFKVVKAGKGFVLLSVFIIYCPPHLQLSKVRS